jgi:hypothetical protein
MTTASTKKIDWSMVVVCTIFMSTMGYLGWKNKFANAEKEKWSQMACPSLLSIGRSARDTLIIMKNEAMCNAFVMDNLK